MSPTTTTIGPAHRVTSLPYRHIAQKAATSRKDAHGSPVLQVSRPAKRFKGRRNGCEYASALVICGGVATSSGDFLWTMMVDRCFVAVDVPDMLLGEKAATVGGFGSYEGCGVDGPFSGV